VRSMLEHSGVDTASQGAGQANFAPFEIVPGDLGRGLVLICDHATNALPPGYGTLGLDPEFLERHIGYDIGARAVTMGLAEELGAPAIMTRFSRLLIDPNRGLDDPTLIMRISDRVVVPGNRDIDPDEAGHRIARYYEPYHRAIDGLIDEAVDAGKPPVLVSIHSFTPSWQGVPRPWQIGVLWDRDPRAARPLIEQLQHDGDLVVGDNEPYTGELEGDTMNTHGTMRGLAHALIEIRQDLIARPDGVREWVERLRGHVTGILETPGVNEVKVFGPAA